MKFKVGDKVRILFKPKINGDHCDSGSGKKIYWNPEMDKLIGIIQTIISYNIIFDIPQIICKKDEETKWTIPEYILEKEDTNYPPIEKFPIQIGTETVNLPQCLIERIKHETS